jgi:ubiquinone/menaquinone biosynthesis C-methylase UbiE
MKETDRASAATSHPEAIVAESGEWQSAHYQEPYYSTRTAKLPAKLKRLGILEFPRSSRILDACCGRGEALTALHRAGFQNLEGIDATPQVNGVSAGFKLHHGDVTRMPFPDRSFDLILNLHALHHLCDAHGVSRFLSECHRILKPGGTLAIMDFPASPQILLLFWLLRKRLLTFTGGLSNFAAIVDEEWSYLEPYLDQWPQVVRVIQASPLTTVRKHQRFFLYYLTMRRGIPET